MSANLAAHTPPTYPYPPYVSVNLGDDGLVRVTVRSPASADGACGATAEIALDAETFRRLAHGALVGLGHELRGG